jgi:UDP-glucuronate decarboxylase
MPTSVVTGGAGFLGSHLCDYLLGQGHRVVCVDNLETGSLENIAHLRDDSFTFLYHDVIEPIRIDEPIDHVFHLAALASPVDYMRAPLASLKIGSYGTHNALGLAKWKRSRFLISSTSEVYGDPQVHPQPETYWGNVNPIGPRGVYDEAKRYAEALTMTYHSQQGVDTAIARIFNSILADEQVLFDDGRELRRERVSELAERLALSARLVGYARSSGGGAALLGADEFELEGFSVPSFRADGRMVAAPASALLAHPPTGPCFELRTRYGRTIRVTGDHSVFVEDSDGMPVAREVAQIEIGDRIAVAGRVVVPERDRRSVSMLDVWRHAEGDPWELTVEAPGLGTLAWKHRFDLHGLLTSERPNAGPNWRNGAWTALIRMRESNRLPLPVLRRVISAIPDGARVRAFTRGRSVSLPERIEITDDLLWLLGLWVAEGTAHEREGRSAFLSLSGAPELLERAAEIIRREFGLHVVSAAGGTARAAALFVHSRLLLRLMDYLGFDRNRKRIPGWILGLPLERLKWFIEGYREGDGVHSGGQMQAGRHRFSTVSEELKDDLVVALGRFGLVPSVGRYESTFKQRTGERRYPFWRLSFAGVEPWSPLEWDRGVGQALNARRCGDLVWSRVVAIREIEPTPLVYDFSVPGLENFWAGTGVMAKNTYGPRMRKNDGRASVNFLNQALAGKPLTVYGDGSQTRSLCYVDDLIRGLYALMMSDEHLPVNLGNPDHEVTMLELAQTVIRVTGSTSEIVFEALPIDDPQIRRPDITRARQILGWAPEIDLDEGLRRWLTALGREPVQA